MSDKFAPKFSKEQRVQIEAVIKELLDTTRESLSAHSDFKSIESINNARNILDSPAFPWIEYLSHVQSDGQKGNPIRTPSKRIAAAKKIKRRTKRTPSIADLKALYSLTVEVDDKTAQIIDADLQSCCSGLPPSLWAKWREMHR